MLCTSAAVSRVGDAIIAGPVSARRGLMSCGTQRAPVCAALKAPVATLPHATAIDRILFCAASSMPYPTSRITVRSSTMPQPFLHDIFDESGRHARSALGVASLPENVLLEIELAVAPAPRFLHGPAKRAALRHENGRRRCTCSPRHRTGLDAPGLGTITQRIGSTMNRRQLLQLGGAVGPAMLLSRSVQAADAELVVGSNVGAPPFAFRQGDTYSGFDVKRG